LNIANYSFRIFCLLVFVAAATFQQTVFAETEYDGSCATPVDIGNLPPGTWCEVPQSKLADAEKKPVEWSDWDGRSSASYSSFQRVMGVKGITAWSGAAFDQRRQRLLVFGGGHNDYGGNEVYAFSLLDLRWQRLTDPTAFPNRYPEIKNHDGTPISRHTYGGLVYLRERDSLFALGGSPDSAPGGCDARGVWFLDLDSLEQDRDYTRSSWTSWGTDGVRVGCNDEAVFDADRNRILYNSFAGWYVLDLSSKSWNQLNKDVWQQRSSSLIVTDEEGTEFLLQFGGGVIEGYVRRSLESDSLTGPIIETTGAREIEGVLKPGVVFDKELGQVVAWAGGGDVYLLDLSTNHWTRREPKPGNMIDPGSPDASGGTFGRFRKSEELGVYVLMDLATENVFLYRLHAQSPDD
jgi:hypothetical protein